MNSKTENPYSVHCSTCQTVNEVFRHYCLNCESVLDNRLPNLDLWSTIGKIIEHPQNAFVDIIRAEHKNFIFFLLFILLLRFASYGAMYGIFVLTTMVPFFHIFIAIPIIAFAIFILHKIMGRQLAKKSQILRYNDLFAGSVYSTLPLIFSGTFLFLLEYIFFGTYLFLQSPNPFMINTPVTWLFIALELLCWGYFVFLQSMLIKTIIGTKVRSMVYAIIFMIFIFISYGATLHFYAH